MRRAGGQENTLDRERSRKAQPTGEPPPLWILGAALGNCSCVALPPTSLSVYQLSYPGFLTNLVMPSLATVHKILLPQPRRPAEAFAALLLTQLSYPGYRHVTTTPGSLEAPKF